MRRLVSLLGLTPALDSVVFVFFFFSSRRRHTRFDCDWSSDVCSSDLGSRKVPLVLAGGRSLPVRADEILAALAERSAADDSETVESDAGGGSVAVSEIGRASCRERV